MAVGEQVEQVHEVTSEPADVRLENVTKRFDDMVAVDNVSIEIPAGSFFALLGPSGCGKTTTLRMIGGFEEPTAGAIFLGGQSVLGLPPYKRDVNTVFQSYALFPHLSVFENIAFGLRRSGVLRNHIGGRVREILKLVDLAGLESRKPRQLSGGQQQRVALARALVNRPRVLLLDEPLGALDLKLRRQMQLELKMIQSELGVTFVHVTHDQEEAMTMADTIAVMNRGQVEQLGPPSELYERPSTDFVASFLGVSNLLPGVASGADTIRLDGGTEVRVLPRRPAGTHRQGRSRHPAGKDPDRRRGQHARGQSVRARLRRRIDAVPRRHSCGAHHGVRAELGAGCGNCGARRPDHGRLRSRSDLRRRHHGGGTVNPRLTRQELIRRATFGAALVSIPGFAAACGGDSGGGSSGEKELAKTLRFSNWTLYIDVDEKTKKRPTLEEFKQKFGVNVVYTEDINSNSEYFGKIQGPLSRGQSIDRDLIVLTDNERYLSVMIDRDWAEKLDKDAIPNIANLVDVQKSPPFDPDREFSLPWQSGMTGIAYDAKQTKPITSVDQLLEDPDLKGRVTMLDNFSDSLGVVMLANGDDPSKVTDESFNGALERVKAASDSGQIRRFTGNDYTGPLSNGDLKAALAWSGDIVQLQADNANLKWGIPQQGGMIWTDNMLIPKGGDVFTASTYMNYVYDPVVAAKLAAYINYVTPVKGAKEELAKTDPETANNQLIFPTEETLSQVHQIDPAALKNVKYQEAWQAVLGA